MSADLVRCYAADFRERLTVAYNMRGRAIGFNISKRYAWELGDIVAEIHGRDVAAEFMYAAGDNLVRRDRVATVQELSDEADGVDDAPTASVPTVGLSEFADMVASRVRTVGAPKTRSWEWWLSGFVLGAMVGVACVRFAGAHA
jgi:hypothetical protein